MAMAVEKEIVTMQDRQLGISHNLFIIRKDAKTDPFMEKLYHI